MPAISARLRAAWHRLRAQPRFRDPEGDFHITPTPLEALDSPPAARHLHGPYLCHHGNYLSLQLGGSTADGVHAIMDCSAPNHLVFSYTQIMAAFPCFRPEPQAICILGLGGGSLAKHSYLHQPTARILVVEISAEVIALRRNFHIPDDDARFSVLQADGAVIVRQHLGVFDVILADAFDQDGTIPHFGTRRFYKSCYRALTGGGVLVLNFSGEHWRRSFGNLNRIFRKQIVLYRCPDGDNTIVFATKAPLPSWALPGASELKVPVPVCDLHPVTIRKASTS